MGNTMRKLLDRVFGLKDMRVTQSQLHNICVKISPLTTGRYVGSGCSRKDHNSVQTTYRGSSEYSTDYW